MLARRLPETLLLVCARSFFNPPVPGVKKFSHLSLREYRKTDRRERFGVKGIPPTKVVTG